MEIAWFILKIVIAGTLISFTSWLAGKKPELAGFIIALPLTSVLALILSYVDHGDNEQSTIFAKSIFIGVPLSLTFFIPFLAAEYTKMPFWINLASGFAFLGLAYFAHTKLLS